MRGVDGVELMLVCMYTADCGCVCASRGEDGWLGKAQNVGLSGVGETDVGGKRLGMMLTVV